MEKRLLNIREVSEYLGLSTNTLYTWISQKKIPYVKMGRLSKFDKKDLDKWIESKKVESKDYTFK